MSENSKLIASVIPAITFLGKFKGEILKLTNLIKSEVDNILDTHLSKYLDNQFDKLHNTKTFLFRDEKVNFYEVFFPVQIKKGNTVIESENISFSLFDNCNYLTLIGNAGSGKTMLMKHFFLQAYTQFLRIPIIIELRHLNEYDGDVVSYIYKNLLQNKILPSEKILERILQSGKFIFLFDGYDEIYSTHKKIITEQLEQFVDQYSNNFFVITSRPGADAETLTRFENYNVCDLNDSQISLFVEQQLKIADELELSERISMVMQKGDNKDYVTYLRNPLLLSMFILTFKQYPDLPRSKNKFYWNVFDTLVTRHDSLSKKGGFQHERKTGLQNEDVEKILKWFGYISLFKGKYSFDKQFFAETLKEIKSKLKFEYDIEELISDLTVSVSLIIIDGLEYKFPHKSFQEYFCASLIRDLDLESKKKVYKEKLPNELSKAQSQTNFWNLCIELDKIYFYELFVIPLLNGFAKKLKTNNTIEKFVKLTNFEVLFIYYEKASTYLYTCTTHRFYISHLIRFFEDDIFVKILDTKLFDKNYGIDCVREIFDTHGGRKRAFTLDENEMVFSIGLLEVMTIWPDFSEKMKILERINIFDSSIKKLIVKLRSEVAAEKKQNVSLLEI